MNIWKILALLAIVLGASRIVNAADPVTPPTLEERIAASNEANAKAMREADAKVQQRAAAAARRAGLSFGQARYEDLTYVGSSIKWGAYQTARGVMNADGYVAGAVAYPAAYVGAGAFSGAEYLRVNASK